MSSEAPDTAESLASRGIAASERGNDADAISLLSRAVKADPSNVLTLVQLGVAYRKAERFDAARYVLERAVRLGQGRHASARLTLADVLERDRRPELALLHYYIALHETRQPNTAQLEHATRYVARGRRAWFENALLQVGNVAESARLQRALAEHLHEHPLSEPHLGQKQGLFYLPELETSRYLDAARVAWVALAAVEVDALADELDTCMHAAAGARQVAMLLRGVLQFEARQHALRLQRLLAQVPLASIAHHAPAVDGISLAAGERLPLQFGLSNARAWVVFNLSDSGVLDIDVGGERRRISPGSQVMLDPSFGVQYVNSAAVRVRALSVEVWHPDVSEPERAALAALLKAAAEFDMRLQDLI